MIARLEVVVVVVVVVLILQDGCIYQKVGLHTGPQFKKCKHGTNDNKSPQFL